jgi:sensor domain CHASE-containing protein
LASFFTRGWRTRVVEHRPKISPAAAPKLVLLWVEAPAGVEVAADLDYSVTTDNPKIVAWKC